jgi:hypothetical protein
MTHKIDATEYSRDSIRDDVRRLEIEAQGRAKAVRLKCLDCVGENAAEVARCHITSCALWPYRFGTDPFSERKASPESVAALAEYRARKAAE